MKYQRDTLATAFSESPTDAIRNLRVVELKFQDWFRNAELDKGRAIPESWREAFQKSYGEALEKHTQNKSKFKYHLVEGDEFLRNYPEGNLGKQLGFLSIVTGAAKDAQRLTRYVNQSSYAQLQLIHETANYSQHSDFDGLISVQDVFSVIVACITLNEQILQSVELETLS